MANTPLHNEQNHKAQEANALDNMDVLESLMWVEFSCRLMGMPNNVSAVRRAYGEIVSLRAKISHQEKAK